MIKNSEKILEKVSELKKALEKDKNDKDKIKELRNLLKPKKGEDYFTKEDIDFFLKKVTPKKGEDYFTQNEIKTIIDTLKLKDEEIKNLKESVRPKKGVDYFDGEKGETPKKGKDYFTDKEVSAIKNIFSKSKRADVTRKIITYNLFSDQVDKICIEIYITRKGRKKPILNSTTFINKLEDEYYWLELKNVLTHNTYNFKCDGFEGLVETMKKLLGE